MHGDEASHSISVEDWGSVVYAEAFARQRELNQRVIDGDADDTIVLVEHDPVITVSHRKGAAAHVLASPDKLESLGIAVEHTDRGGDVTYHGPGQLVAYPILRLNHYGLNLSRYMRLLEQSVIDTVAAFDVAAHREPGATGVWVKRDGQPSAKLAALGVRIRKNVTLHGLALNVTTTLEHFRTIDPCGLGDRPVTALHQLLGAECPPMDSVKAELVNQLRRQLDAARAQRADTSEQVKAD